MTVVAYLKRAGSCACVLSALVFAQHAAALEVAGVKIDESAHVANRDLILNGAGIRYKAIFKVYTAALYLSEKKTTPADVLNSTGPRRITLVMLRDLSSEDLGQAFMAGIQRNLDKADRAKIINQLIKFGELFGSIPEVKKGDAIIMDWIPSTGTSIQVNGKNVGEVLPGVDFYNALLRTWLGDKPSDSKLKLRLLGDMS
jgi:hypothetical protein